MKLVCAITIGVLAGLILDVFTTPMQAYECYDTWQIALQSETTCGYTQNPNTCDFTITQWYDVYFLDGYHRSPQPFLTVGGQWHNNAIFPDDRCAGTYNQYPIITTTSTPTGTIDKWEMWGYNGYWNVTYGVCTLYGANPVKVQAAHRCPKVCVAPDGGTGRCPRGFTHIIAPGNDCCPSSPILIDTLGNGFALSDEFSGVSFDMGGDGVLDQLAWTLANSDDAWLALDRNGNGKIDSSLELFGNLTNQPSSSSPNGFLALAEFDKPSMGGNNDGSITSADAVFASLRLWQDTNHNGVSTAAELKTLSSQGIALLGLSYGEYSNVDAFGNEYVYRAVVLDNQGKQSGRWAWDVFLVTQP